MNLYEDILSKLKTFAPIFSLNHFETSRAHAHIHFLAAQPLTVASHSHGRSARVRKKFGKVNYFTFRISNDLFASGLGPVD